MSTLYITEQGSMLKRSGRRLIVTAGGQIKSEKHVHDIARILVFGNVQITTQAISLILENGIDLSYFSSGGSYRGKLVSQSTKNIYLKIAQVTRWQDKNFRLQLAKIIVSSKLQSQLKNLLARRRGINCIDLLNRTNDLISQLIDDINNCSNEGQLRGIEGSASKAYFECWDEILPQEMPFTKRSRRPALNEVNSAMNFAYTLLLNEVNGNIESRGFDPMFGFFHSIRYGRVSLTLDLMDPLRAILVDRWLLTIIRRNELKKEDFIEQGEKGVWLSDEGRKKFLTLHNQWIHKSNYRLIIERLVAGYEETVMEGTTDGLKSAAETILSDML